MIKHLKLTKAIVAIVLGIIALVTAKIMEAYKVDGNQIVLGVSGVLFIAGALMFLYPIVFAQKADKDGRNVALKPIEKEPIDQAANAG